MRHGDACVAHRAHSPQVWHSPPRIPVDWFRTLAGLHYPHNVLLDIAHQRFHKCSPLKHHHVLNHGLQLRVCDACMRVISPRQRKTVDFKSRVIDKLRQLIDCERTVLRMQDEVYLPDPRHASTDKLPTDNTDDSQPSSSEYCLNICHSSLITVPTLAVLHSVTVVN